MTFDSGWRDDFRDQVTYLGVSDHDTRFLYRHGGNESQQLL